jgi:hypothetical protein
LIERTPIEAWRQTGLGGETRRCARAEDLEHRFAKRLGAVDHHQDGALEIESSLDQIDPLAGYWCPSR